MICRFIDYNLLVTFMGNLDQDKLGRDLKKVLEEQSVYIPLINQDVSVLKYEDYNMIRINVLYFIKNGIFNQEQKNEIHDKMISDLDEKINRILKRQKIIFNIER